MRAAFLIAGRELSAYLRTMSGYVIMAIVLLVDGLLFNVFALTVPGRRLSGEVLNNFFYIASGTTMIASVFISMRLLAEERQTGTLSLLYSSPVRDGEIVVGKFVSALVFLAIMTAGTVFMPALILINGKISFGHILAGYLGLLLLGGAALAIGIFGSALAKSQIIAAIVSGSLLTFLVACWLLARVTERPLSEIFTAMALHNQHFQPFQAGLVHVRDIVYYLAVTYVSLFAATRVLEARRWR